MRSGARAVVSQGCEGSEGGEGSPSLEPSPHHAPPCLQASESRVVVGGTGIDKACLLWADDFGAMTMRGTYDAALVLPFSSVTKLSAGVWRAKDTGVATVLVKGAPEYVLARCTHQYGDVGQVRPASERPHSSGRHSLPPSFASHPAGRPAAITPLPPSCPCPCPPPRST